MIDKKGRIHIFKFKINIIDFLVLLFLLCLLPMFYFGYKIMTKPQVLEVQPPTVTIDKAEYEEYDWKFKQLEAQRDNLLSEHKRLQRYFK